MRFELHSFGDAMVAPLPESRRDGERAAARDVWVAFDEERSLGEGPGWIAWWRSSVTAVSVFAAHVLAGVAWAAVATYPNILVGSDRRVDDDEPIGGQPLYRLDCDRPPSGGIEGRNRGRDQAEKRFDMNSFLFIENMSIAEPARSGRPSLQARLVSMPVRAWTRLVEAHQTRRAIADMSALDDRMLKDIGVPRGQIGRVVREGRDGW